MPRSRSPSPYRKTVKSRRKRSHTKSPSDSYRKSSRRSSRSLSKSKKSKRYRSAERRSRRSRSTSAKLRRQSRSPSTKYSSSRKSRSRRQPSRSSSSSTSSSSKSNSPAEERYIPLTKNKESKKSKASPPSPPVGIFDSVKMLLDEPVMPETLDFINADEFVAKTFTSTKKIMDKVVIDLTGETSVPVADAIMEVDSIFHPNLYADDAIRMEKYVKKLYNYRQKMFYGN